jgi:hypothetical protein
MLSKQERRNLVISVVGGLLVTVLVGVFIFATSSLDQLPLGPSGRFLSYSRLFRLSFTSDAKREELKIDYWMCTRRFAVYRLTCKLYRPMLTDE